MDLADLRTFEAVARHGSMNKAAVELHTVQSNVTARIRALEDELGVALFQRHARGVTVTSAAQRMLPFVGRIAQLVSEARAAATDSGQPSGTLTLGTLETTMALRLSPLLTEYARAWPEVRLVVSSGTTAGLMQAVIDYRLDGAFVAGPVHHPALYVEPVFTEELVLITSPAIRSLRELSGLRDLKTVVFQSGCSYRQRLDAFLAGLGIVAARPLEFGSLDAIVNCVSAGIGITLLPKGVVADAASAGDVTIHHVPRELAMVDTMFIRREDCYVSSAMTVFLETAKRIYRQSKAPPGRGRRAPEPATAA